MQIDDFKGISGINFEKLPSGKFRVQIGKRITGGKVIRKTGDEVFVCRLAITKDTVKTSYEVGNSPVILRSSYDTVVDDVVALRWFLVKIKS